MGLLDRIRRRFRTEPVPEDAPGLFTARSATVPERLRERAGEPERGEDLWDQPAAPPEADASARDEAEVAAPREVEPTEVEPTGIEALEAFDPEPDEPTEHVRRADPDVPPAPADIGPADAVWDDATWEEDAPAGGAPTAMQGSTADEPLFGDHRAAPDDVPPPATEPVPPLFDRPEVEVEPEPEALVEEPTEEPEVAPDEAAHVDDEGRTVRVHDARVDRRPGPIKMTPSEAIALAQEGPRALHRRTHPGS